MESRDIGVMTEVSSETGEGMTEFLVMFVLVVLVILISLRLFGKSTGCELSSALATGPVVENEAASGDCVGRRPAVAVPPVPEPVVVQSPPPAQAKEETQLGETGGLTVNNPTENGSPLDHCLNFGANCDQPAADAFCQRRGHSGAESFTLGGSVDHSWIAGDGKLCQTFEPHPPFCKIFSQIRCKP